MTIGEFDYKKVRPRTLVLVGMVLFEDDVKAPCGVSDVNQITRDISGGSVCLVNYVHVQIDGNPFVELLCLWRDLS